MVNAVYIRVSTDVGEQDPYNQLNDLKGFMPSDSIIFEDRQTAWKEKKDRPEFNKLKSEIKSKKISNLYVWDLDRFFRNRKNLIGFFEFCGVYGCKIYSYRQQWLSDLNNIPVPFNEIMHNLMLQIMGWLAEEESIKKSDRVKSAIRTKNGVTVSYKGNKWGKKSLSNQTVTKVLELVDEGLSYRKICTQVWIYDKYGNKKKNISLGMISKIVKGRSQNLS